MIQNYVNKTQEERMTQYGDDILVSTRLNEVFLCIVVIYTFVYNAQS